MLVSTTEFQKNLSCRETEHLGTGLNNSQLFSFFFSLSCALSVSTDFSVEAAKD